MIYSWNNLKINTQQWSDEADNFFKYNIVP